MNQTETLFVVGAGASHEVGLPLGRDLTDEIARNLDIKFEPFDKMISGNHRVYEALKVHVKENGGDIVSFQTDGCWTIRDAMPQAVSIDSFVDSHRGNAEIELCSKLGIAASILESERGSNLFVGDEREDKLEFGAVADTWYDGLFRRITDRCTVDELPGRLASIAFIVFNYDRCIEHFLFHAIQNYYRVDGQRAADLLAPLEIYHPFGVVGELPWRGGGDATPFGVERSGEKLLAIANSILTISESAANRASVDAWGEALGAAQRVIFLGFGFLDQNMSLLVPAESSKKVRKRIFATAHGISDSDREIVIDSIKKRIGGAEIIVRGDLRCSKLFGEFSRSLFFK